MRWRGEKKTLVESRPLHDAATVGEGYEVLRASVLEDDSFSAIRSGLSVFLSQGMTAWMQVYRLLPSHSPSKSGSVLRNPPSGLADEVVALIADMFLNHQEASRC